MDAIFNDKDEVHPVNVPNRGGVLEGFPEDLVVEVPGRCTAAGIEPLRTAPLPRHLRGLVMMLGEYQALAAEAAWSGVGDGRGSRARGEPAGHADRPRRAALRRAGRRTPRPAPGTAGGMRGTVC